MLLVLVMTMGVAGYGNLHSHLTELSKTHCMLARKSANSFMTYVIQDEETGNPIRQSPQHIEWQNLYDRHKRLLIWSSIESGKSWQFSVGRTLFELGKNPSLRCLVVMNTDLQAQKIAMTVGKHIENNDRLKAVFPGLMRAPGLPWTHHSLYVQRPYDAKDPSLQTCGIHGNVLGARIDRLILDDILDYENTLTQQQRDSLWDWIHATLEGRLTRDARVTCIGTAWHRDDVMHRLAKNKAWFAVRYPVEKPNGDSAWPDRWPKERIAEKAQVLGTIEANRQLRCIARSDEEAIFKRSWIDQCVARGDGKRMPHALAQIPPGYQVYSGVDLGISQKAKADLTVIFTIAIHPNEDREVLNVESGRWPGPEIIRRILDVYHRYWGIVYCESNQAQDYLIQFTKHISAVPIRPYTTVASIKNHPEFGLEALAVEFENAKWIIPSQDSRCAPEVEAWINEMLYYDPRGHTGDRLMASYLAKEGFRLTKPAPQVGTFRIDLLSR